jgi:hypothetical protein
MGTCAWQCVVNVRGHRSTYATECTAGGEVDFRGSSRCLLTQCAGCILVERMHIFFWRLGGLFKGLEHQYTDVMRCFLGTSVNKNCPIYCDTCSKIPAMDIH